MSGAQNTVDEKSCTIFAPLEVPEALLFESCIATYYTIAQYFPRHNVLRVMQDFNIPVGIAIF